MRENRVELVWEMTDKLSLATFQEDDDYDLLSLESYMDNDQKFVFHDTQ